MYSTVLYCMYNITLTHISKLYKGLAQYYFLYSSRVCFIHDHQQLMEYEFDGYGSYKLSEVYYFS